jgi:hypothetical protein
LIYRDLLFLPLLWIPAFFKPAFQVLFAKQQQPSPDPKRFQNQDLDQKPYNPLINILWNPCARADALVWRVSALQIRPFIPSRSRMFPQLWTLNRELWTFPYFLVNPTRFFYDAFSILKAGCSDFQLDHSIKNSPPQTSCQAGGKEKQFIWLERLFCH